MSFGPLQSILICYSFLSYSHITIGYLLLQQVSRRVWVGSSDWGRGNRRCNTIGRWPCSRVGRVGRWVGGIAGQVLGAGDSNHSGNESNDDL